MAEMLSKVDQKIVSPASFIWAEGMTDWKLLKEIPAFEGVDKKAAPATEKSAKKENKASKPEDPSGPTAMESLKAVSVPLDMTPLKNTAQPRPINTDQVEKSWKRRRLIRNAIKAGVAAGVVGGVGFVASQGVFDSYVDTSAIRGKVQTLTAGLMDQMRPQLLSLADKYPALSKVISPIPHLKDVSTEDYERLRAAASEHLDKGPSIAVAQSSEDLAHPSFYVSSNLPDGARFDIYLEGKSETLVGKIHSSAKLSVTIAKNIGKTEALSLPQNARLPIGEYQVFATESDQQPEAVTAILKSLPPLNAAKTDRLPAGLKLLSRRSAFLGGTKDEVYNVKLREYRTQLDQKARIELADLKDLGSMLEKQIQGTIHQFKVIRKGRGITAGKKKAWSNFHAEWMRTETTWLDRFSKLTPEVLHDDYVYSEQYELARQAGQELQKLHDLQNDYFESRLDERGLEIQLGTATSVVESAFVAFTTKTEQAEKTPASQ
jgi:hypothetical protein